MISINHVILTGYLGSDPEVRESTSGYSYICFSLATHQSRRKADNEWTRQTHWHRVLVFGPQAEKCRLFLKKGSPIAIEGSLSSWENKNLPHPPLKQVVILATNVSFLFNHKNNFANENEENEISPHQSTSLELNMEETPSLDLPAPS